MNEDQEHTGPATLYDPDEITSFGKFLGVGRENACLVTVEAKLSTKRKWMLEAKFEILEGENEGFERKLRYPLGIVKWQKNGRSGIAAGGIADMKRDLANIGRPWAREKHGQFTDQPDEVYATKIARVYNAAFGGLTVELHTVFDKDAPIKNDDGTPKLNEKGEPMYWTRTSVTRIAGAKSSAASESGAQSKLDALLKA